MQPNPRIVAATERYAAAQAVPEPVIETPIVPEPVVPEPTIPEPVVSESADGPLE